jgi:hypothetical protein
MLLRFDTSLMILFVTAAMYCLMKQQKHNSEEDVNCTFILYMIFVCNQRLCNICTLQNVSSFRLKFITLSQAIDEYFRCIKLLTRNTNIFI